jgi:hypothetical protein
MSQIDDERVYQPGLDDLLSLNEAAELCGLSASHLRLLVRRGEVWGKKLGRNWVTTEQAVRQYVARDRRPGPKTKMEPDNPREALPRNRKGVHHDR